MAAESTRNIFGVLKVWSVVQTWSCWFTGRLLYSRNPGSSLTRLLHVGCADYPWIAESGFQHTLLGSYTRVACFLTRRKCPLPPFFKPVSFVWGAGGGPLSFGLFVGGLCVCARARAYMLVQLPASDLAGLVHCSLHRSKCCIKLPSNLAKRLDSGRPIVGGKAWQPQLSVRLSG